jgi:ribonuclease J
VLSAKAIPGNERSIGKLINRLYRLGAMVIHEKVSEIHVSGHASKEELKLMLNMVRPRYFMPIHGEYRHLITHAHMIQRHGVPAERTFILNNGDVLKITPEGARKDGQVKSGRVYIDGKGVGDVGEMVLRDRRRMGQDGFVLVMVTVDKESGALVGTPEIITRGFTLEGEAQEIIPDAIELLVTRVAELDREITADPSLLRDKVRSILKKHFRNSLQRMPMIMPLVFEV